MPAMYARLRDEAQVEIDAWLAQGGGLKTIVSITQVGDLSPHHCAAFLVFHSL